MRTGNDMANCIVNTTPELEGKARGLVASDDACRDPLQSHALPEAGRLHESAVERRLAILAIDLDE